MKRILIATDSFKESLTCEEVAEAITTGFYKAGRDVETAFIPIADGGEGTVKSLVLASNGRQIFCDVVGPLGEVVTATYGISGDSKTAFIEMASASGLALVPVEKRNPMITTTYGTGQLINEALDKGVEKIIIGIGGSATNDGGLGMAQALGISCKDHLGNELGFGGAELSSLDTIEIPSELRQKLSTVEIKVACDVDNPLTGDNGASTIYGPQKGATPRQVNLLDNALIHFAEIIQKELKIDIDSIAGAGAAGGLGAGLVAFTGGILQSGIGIVMEYLTIEKHLDGVDLVVVGEGKMDNQTLKGKAPVGVSRLAMKKGIPVIAVVGVNESDPDLMKVNGIIEVFESKKEEQTIPEAMANARQNIIDVVKTIDLSQY